MRTLVIGDIHGGLKALIQILEKSNFTTADTLIFLGDYVDGWSDSPRVIDFLIELQTTHKCICIRGNHDELLLDWLQSKNENIDESMWYKHGGESTALAYEEVNEETKLKHIAFLQSLHDYYLDAQNRLFIHAGFTNMNGVKFEYFPKLFYWDRSLWETALALDVNMNKQDLLYPKRFTIYNEIYIGHTPVTRIGKTTPVQKANVWNMDTGAAFKGPLTIMDIETREYWQSHPLSDLYPDEKGRN